MRRRVGVLAAVLSLVTVLLPVDPASACSCALQTEAEQRSAADTVFVGTATDVREEGGTSAPGEPEPSSRTLITTFDVGSVEEGDPGGTATVRSGSDEAACGFRFVEGTRYRVFASVDDTRQAEFVTSLCAGNQELPPLTADLPAAVRGTTWLLRDSHTSGPALSDFDYGPGGTPMSGDWDGDGTRTPGWFRDGVWFLRDRNGPGAPDRVLRFGSAGDVPVVGDWDGDPDAVTDLGVVRRTRSGLVWLLETARTSDGEVATDGRADVVFHFGSGADRPVTGRWLDPGCAGCEPRSHAGVVRSDARGLVWLLETGTDAQGRPTSDGSADLVLRYGSSGDHPLVGDWDGDGLDDLGVVRGNRWLLETADQAAGSARVTATDGSAGRAFVYGRATDRPVAWNR